MRILHVVGRSYRRGAETFALELARELDRLGHQDRVVALGLAFDGSRDPELAPLTNRVDMGPRTLAASAWRLRRLVHREHHDVLVAHGGSAAQAAGFARGRGGPALVWQRILEFPPAVWRSPLRRRWWRVVARRVDAAVAITPPLGDELRRLRFTGPVWVIANTRAPERFVGVDRDEAAVRLRREAGVADDVPLVGFVGHLVDQKRPERALEVLARVHAHGQPAHLVVAGDGPLRAPFEREARERGLDAHVSVLGHRSDVECVYGGLDLLLLTSDAEGVPGVAIEAQMTGCPVVSFPLGGVSEVVEDGRTGVVLEDADTALMAEHAVRLLQRPDLRLELGAEGRRRAAEFSMGPVAEEYAACLSALCATRAGAGTSARPRSRRTRR